MHIIKNNLGSIVKAARLNKGLTQEILAEKVGVGLRHIMGIENEGNFPSYELLYNLIQELNIPADSIFYPEKNFDNKQVEYLTHLLEQCNDKNIRAIIALVESLLDESECIQ